MLTGLGSGLVALTPAIPVILTLTAAFVGIGFALGLAAPGIEAIGNAIGTTLTGLTSMLEVVTLEKAAAFMLLGYSFLSLSAGVGALAIAALLGGGKVTSFIEKIGSLDTSVLSKNAMAVNSFAEGIGRLNAELQTLDTEKLEKLEDVSLSLSVGAAVTGVADSIGGMIDAASNTLFGEGGTDVQTKMLAELIAIKEKVGVGKVIKMDSTRVGKEVASKNDQDSQNVNQVG